MSQKNIFIQCLFVFFFIAFTANAQEKYFKGTVQISQKKSVEAYVLLDYSNPQKFQRTVTYVDPVVFNKYKATGKVKRSAMKTVDAKSIIGFKLDDGRKFKTIKYREPIDGPKSNLIPRVCLEQISDGTIQMFKFYSHTDEGKVAPELLDAIHESLAGGPAVAEYLKNNFLLIVRKSTKAPKNVLRTDVLELIGDNSDVSKHYENDYYGVKELLVVGQNDYYLANQEMEAAFRRMLYDYNGIQLTNSK